MTPQEKANQLKGKFSQFVMSGDAEDWQQDSRLAKQCALICVDEVLQLLNTHTSDCAVNNEAALPKGECDCCAQSSIYFYEAVKTLLTLNTPTT